MYQSGALCVCVCFRFKGGRKRDCWMHFIMMFYDYSGRARIVYTSAAEQHRVRQQLGYVNPTKPTTSTRTSTTNTTPTLKLCKLST